MNKVTNTETNQKLWAFFRRVRNLSYFTLLPFLIGKILYEIGWVNPNVEDHFIQHIFSGYLLFFVSINFFIAIPFVTISIVASIIYYLFTGKYLLGNEKLNEKLESFMNSVLSKLKQHFKLT